MNRLQQAFTNLHVVLPVVHVRSEDQAIENARIARDEGADGVFLINHDIGIGSLLEIFQEVRGAFPEFWIGVNLLGASPARTFRLIEGTTSGVWTDSAEIDERSGTQETAKAVQATIASSGFTGLYFGGVAFKYQRPVTDLEGAARIATNYMDVVTTSGQGTGEAPAVEKIRRMIQAIGAFPLAIASGITPENVADFLPFADAFLVATGISRDFYNIDPERLGDLVRTVRAFTRTLG